MLKLLRRRNRLIRRLKIILGQLLIEVGEQLAFLFLGRRRLSIVSVMQSMSESDNWSFARRPVRRAFAFPLCITPSSVWNFNLGAYFAALAPHGEEIVRHGAKHAAVAGKDKEPRHR